MWSSPDLIRAETLALRPVESPGRVALAISLFESAGRLHIILVEAAKIDIYCATHEVHDVATLRRPFA